MGLIADVIRDVFDVREAPPATTLQVDGERERADHLAATLRATMEAGAIPIWPVPWNKVLCCARCGPVPFGWAGEVAGCPWCWVRVDGLQVPRAGHK